jgi:hypothetical protein
MPRFLPAESARRWQSHARLGLSWGLPLGLSLGVSWGLSHGLPGPYTPETARQRIFFHPEPR